ncbi:MAG: hypothetical protein LBJ31_10280 [Treponema sp.]|nr:hypothetical protein [Treponema sp.]
MKIITALISIVLFCIIFFGCRTWQHSNNEVKKYVKKNISTSPFIISDAGHDGTRKYWQIYFEDKPDYIFRVFSQKSGLFGMPMGYDLTDNFNFMFSYYYLNEFNQTHTGSLYATTDYDIEGRYTKDGARIFANDIQEYYDYIHSQPYPAKVKIKCRLVAKNGNELDDFYLFFDKLHMQNNATLSPFSKLITEVTEKNIETALTQFIETYTKRITDFNHSLPELNEKREGNGLKPLPPKSENENESWEDYWNKNR